MTTPADARELARLGASLFDRGRTHGRTGNISLRRDRHFVVTPTGASLGNLDPDRLSVVDFDGRHLHGPRPTKESFLHAAVYRSRPRSNAIVHLHSTHTVAVSCLADRQPGQDVLPPLTAYYVMRVGRCPLLPYHPPGDERLTPAIEAIAGDRHAFLLANHGPVVAGRNLQAACDAIEELEETARLYLLLLGSDARPLTEAQVRELGDA